MKTFVLVLPLLLMGSGVVGAAECPPGSELTLIGSIAVGAAGSDSAGQTDLVIGSGALVRKLTQTCGGTACVGTAFDADSNSDATPRGTGYVNATVKAEPGAPANESRTLAFDPALRFENGISIHNTAAANVTLAYGCKQGP